MWRHQPERAGNRHAVASGVRSSPCRSVRVRLRRCRPRTRPSWSIRGDSPPAQPAVSKVARDGQVLFDLSGVCNVTAEQCSATGFTYDYAGGRSPLSSWWGNPSLSMLPSPRMVEAGNGVRFLTSGRPYPGIGKTPNNLLALASWKPGSAAGVRGPRSRSESAAGSYGSCCRATSTRSRTTSPTAKSCCITPVGRQAVENRLGAAVQPRLLLPAFQPARASRGPGTCQSVPRRLDARLPGHCPVRHANAQEIACDPLPARWNWSSSCARHAAKASWAWPA